MNSRLVNRNIAAFRGRTSMRLEPELWEALEDICRREHTTQTALVRRLEQENTVQGSRTSMVRVYIVSYFRAAAARCSKLEVG